MKQYLFPGDLSLCLLHCLLPGDLSLVLGGKGGAVSLPGLSSRSKIVVITLGMTTVMGLSPLIVLLTLSVLLLLLRYVLGSSGGGGGDSLFVTDISQDVVSCGDVEGDGCLFLLVCGSGGSVFTQGTASDWWLECFNGRNGLSGETGGVDDDDDVDEVEDICRLVFIGSGTSSISGFFFLKALLPDPVNVTSVRFCLGGKGNVLHVLLPVSLSTLFSWITFFTSFIVANRGSLLFSGCFPLSVTRDVTSVEESEGTNTTSSLSLW